jgi:hypothetical protein
MSIKVRYIGNVTPYFAPVSTGILEAWRPGVAMDVSSAQATALLALGVFELETGQVVSVAASRAITAQDNGAVLECTAVGVTLTVPAGLPAGFAVLAIPSGTTTIASSGGALLNGATASLTRSAAANAAFSILPRSAADSYVVTGV